VTLLDDSQVLGNAAPMGATSSSTNPFLAGNMAPVDVETTAVNLTITGTLPAELCGRYLRNGPNPVTQPDPATYHWFTGTGMVHGISLRDGRAEWYRNRWVRNDEVAATLGESAPPNPWPADHMSFSANTNVIGFAGRTLALVEGGAPPVELDDELATVAISDLDGSLPYSFSAHPKLDAATGELHVMAYYWGWGNRVQYLVVGTDGRVRATRDIELPGSPMIHDTAITERYALVFDLPVLFDMEAAMAGSLPYRWFHDYQPRIGLVPRDDAPDGVAGNPHGDVQWFNIDPCYIFHPLNAYDEITPDGGRRVVLDAVRHPKMFDTERRGPNEGRPRLDRWVLDLDSGSVSTSTLDDHPQEFPRIREDLVGRRHRYGYTAGLGSGLSQDTLCRIDTTTGTVVRRSDNDRMGYGEPVFIPRDGSTAEDDGWVMALRHDRDTDRSDLCVFSADALADDPVAVVHLPVRVPNGFHGNWIVEN